MADNTIDTNSFFNQPEEGGGISAVKVLAQNAFDIATNIRTQFNNFVQTFDQYKLEAGESDRLISNTVSNLDIQTDETDRTIEKTINDFNKKFKAIEDDIRGQDKKIEAIESKVDQVSEVFFKFEQSQKAAAEKAADDAFRAQDAAQKAGDGKEGPVAAGLGGLGGMFGGGDKGSGGGGGEEKKKGKGFWNNPWMWGLMGTGALHGMGAGINRGIGGAADFLTGGLFDFDGQSGGGGLRKIGSGLKNMFGGKKKEKEKGVEAEVDSLESRVEGLEKIASGEATLKDGQVVSGDMSQEDAEKTSKILDLESDLMDAEEIYGLDSPEANEIKKEIMILEGTPKDAIYEDKEGNIKVKGYSTFESKEGTDEKGLEPKGEEGEKKEKGLFGGFFGGLFGKKEKKEKEDKGKVDDKPEVKTSSFSDSIKYTVKRGEVDPDSLEEGVPLEKAQQHWYKKNIKELNFKIRNGKKRGTDTSEMEKQLVEWQTKYNNTLEFGGIPVGYQDDKGLQPTGEKGEKGEGGGLKDKLAGAADFMTGGMFDFDNKNRKGAPKDFGIRRMAGGIADSMTMGLTDFDKRGKGNLQVNPLFGGKDKAWGAADEQAKRGEKQSGMGIKRGIGGALDFATLGTFDFDKQNKKGSPKGWGIKRIAGGVSDWATMGLTDFDKRGKGNFQFDAISGGKSTSSKTDRGQTSGKKQSITEKYLKDKGMDLTQPQGGLSHEEYTALTPRDRNLLDRHLRVSNLKGELKTEISPVPSGSGANFNKLSQPPEGDGTPEVLPIQTVAGDNTASNIINQMAADKGDFSTDDDTADGTECTIECINMMKANSTRLIKF